MSEQLQHRPFPFSAAEYEDCEEEGNGKNLVQTDVITMLDWYMVEEVCSFLEKAQAEGIKIRPVSINFSRWHLHEKDMAERLAEIVDSHHLDHSFIVVKITESAMIDEENRMREMVAKLHGKGFEFSIDDFGSGLSSLSMVADTLPDEIKIDRSLLKKNCEDERERIILIAGEKARYRKRRALCHR